MIVLDTNVVSELMREARPRGVTDWLEALDPKARFTTTITLAELAYGTARLPDGRRRDGMREAQAIVVASFGSLILTFDLPAAEAYAIVRAEREAIGRPIGALDAQIAAICRVHGAALATRNTRDFEGLGLELVNPWEA